MSSNNTSTIVSGPARGTKHLTGSLHRDSRDAIPRVLRLLAKRAEALGPIEISLGYLEPPLSSEDARAQVTIEFFAATKRGEALKAKLKRNRVIGEGRQEPCELEAVRRMVIRLPRGDQQDNLALLLEKCADEISKLNQPQILDLFISVFQEADGVDWPQVTIYYRDNKEHHALQRHP